MDAITQMVNNWSWLMNGFGLFLILMTRLFSNTKGTWLGVGVILLVIAIGNSLIISAAGQDPDAHAASLIALVFYGALGCTFISNWLTERAA